MAVGFVVGSTSQNSFAANTSFSNAINFTTVGGANHVLIVSLHFSANPGTISSVTYNGTNMTQFGTTIVNTEATAIYYQVNPAAGNNTLHAAWTNSAVNGWIGAEFSGVSSGTPLANYTTATGTGSSITMTITGVPAGDGSYAANSNAGANISTNTQTLIVASQMTGGTSGLETSYSLNSGSVTFTWNNFNSVTWAGAIVDIQQNNPFTWLMMGDFDADIAQAYWRKEMIAHD